MSAGVALGLSDVPLVMHCWPEVSRRIYRRGGEPEVRFLYDDREPVLPLWVDGGLKLVYWGNGRGRSRCLPRTGWTWRETVQQGGWGGATPTVARIAASLVWEKGVWYRVRQGVQGLLVEDEHGRDVVYMICEPSSHYYRVMTRSDRMPALIEEQI